MQDTRTRGHRVLVPNLLGEVGQAAMGDDDALRRSRRPGRVDQIRGMVHEQRTGPFRTGEGFLTEVFEFVDIRGQPCDGAGQSGALRADGQPDCRTAIVQGVRDASARVRGIDRNVGGAGLRDGPQRQHRLERPRDGDRDDALGSDAPAGQEPGEPAGEPVQVTVGQFASAVADRDRLRVVGDGPREETVECDRVGIRKSLRGSEFSALAGEEDVEVGDRSFRLDRCGEPVEVGEETRMMSGQFGVVVQCRISLEVDAGGAALCPRIDVDGEVRDGTGGEYPDRPVHGAERDLLREHHDVDHRTEMQEFDTARGEVPADVLAAVALMPQCRCQRRLGGSDRLTDGGRADSLQPQRNHIGDRTARIPEAGRRSRRHRKRQDHVVDAGHPGEVGGEGGDRHRRRIP